MKTSLNYTLIAICVIYFTLLVWGLVILRHLWMVFYATRSSGDAQYKLFDSEPLISIIIPAYNEGKVIEDALKSMLTLNYSNYEMIIVDDGSSDETLVIVQNFARQHRQRYRWRRGLFQAFASNLFDLLPPLWQQKLL